jgi:hypothetical protein
VGGVAEGHGSGDDLHEDRTRVVVPAGRRARLEVEAAVSTFDSPRRMTLSGPGTSAAATGVTTGPGSGVVWAPLAALPAALAMPPTEKSRAAPTAAAVSAAELTRTARRLGTGRRMQTPFCGAGNEALAANATIGGGPYGEPLSGSSAGA